MLRISIPPQGSMLQNIPVRIPACSATSPITQGMRIAPLLAAGSMIPMLATLVICPAHATAVGFIPAMDAAKAKRRRIAGHWLPACIRPK